MTIEEQTPEAQSANPLGDGYVDRWWFADRQGAWAELTVTFGPFVTKVVMPTEQARAFALDVIVEQGPNLTFQPPNDRMRERGPWDRTTIRHERGFEHRGRIRDCAKDLTKLCEHYGDRVFDAALQRARVVRSSSGE